MQHRVASAAVTGIALLLCPVAASAMGLSFQWGPTKKCFDPKSPPITLSGVPAHTSRLRFKMIDLDAVDFVHGGATIDYTGDNKLPYGAFRYKGPCPPKPHVYQWRVEALDGNGKVLAKARASKRFP
jgi:phosphatidylethanolamine-binding protein (PEBP) family uncharacterized protein